MGPRHSQQSDPNYDSLLRYDNQIRDIDKGETILDPKDDTIKGIYDTNEKTFPVIDGKINNVYSTLDTTNKQTLGNQTQHQKNIQEIDGLEYKIVDTNHKIGIEAPFQDELKELNAKLRGLLENQKATTNDTNEEISKKKRERIEQYRAYHHLIQAENEKIVDTQTRLDDYLMMGDKTYSLEDETNITMQYYLFGLLCIYYVCGLVFMYFYIVSGPFSTIEDWYIRYFLYFLVGAVLFLYPFTVYTIEKYILQYSYWVYCFCFNEVYGILSIFPR